MSNTEKCTASPSGDIDTTGKPENLQKVTPQKKHRGCQRTPTKWLEVSPVVSGTSSRASPAIAPRRSERLAVRARTKLLHEIDEALRAMKEESPDYEDSVAGDVPGPKDAPPFEDGAKGV